MKYQQMIKFFEQEYEFKICSKAEITEVIDFIDNHWQKNHALVLSRPLMDWQHFDTINNRYNFSFARHRQSGEIHALQGLIPSSQYDPEILNPIVWGGIWKVRSDINNSGLGMMVRLYGEIEIPGCARGGIGLSNDASSIEKKLNIRNGICNQYYMLNRKILHFRLAANIPPGHPEPKFASNPSKTIIPLKEDDYYNAEGPAFTGIPPYKSKNYYLNRFYRHPIYTYHVAGILEAKQLIGVFFYRICEAQDSRCIRIVDYFGTGDSLPGNADNFQKLMEDTSAEYIDFFNTGINPELFFQTGFDERHRSDIIIPNYFEPFLQKNIELAYSLSSKDPNFPILFFKADGDQDRPNRIPKP